MNLDQREIEKIEKFKKLHQEYLKEIQPYVDERVKIAMMFSSIYMDEYGNIHYKYEPRVQFIDDKLKWTIDLIRELYFGNVPESGLKERFAKSPMEEISSIGSNPIVSAR